LFGGPTGFARTSALQFDIPQSLRTYGGGVTVRGVGDIDGDGFSDVAIGINTFGDNCVDIPNGPPPTSPAYVDIYRGAATNPLTQTLPRLQGWGEVAPLADIDGDGHPDLGVVRNPLIYQTSTMQGYHCASFNVHLVPGEMRVLYGGSDPTARSTTWALPTY